MGAADTPLLHDKLQAKRAISFYDTPLVWPNHHSHEQLTKGGEGPDGVGMVLGIEVSDLLGSFSPQAVQEGVSWVVHHLSERPQRVGNIASTEHLHI